jgi:L-ascorbate metabolism protein UlaG (beta-lactamase superfamily)
VLERFTWFRQSAMRFGDEAFRVYIDPWGTSPDDGAADVVFITHAHDDHFNPEEIDQLRKDTTKLVAPRDVAEGLTGDVTAVAPGESYEVGGVRFRTVRAYNIAEHRLERHPRENNWVGYVIDLDGRSYYHSGDTDHVPELDDVVTDVAMVCIGGDPFTMGPQEAGELVKTMTTRLAVPMHYGFVVGSPSQAEEFRRAADPVPVEELTPMNPFERD